jgi:hypothetical protein
MDYLSENWFVTPLFDVEYKHYQVLGYVQKLHRHFEEKRLFPYFDDLLRHIQNLETLTKTKLDFEKDMGQKVFMEPSEVAPIPISNSLKDLTEILAFADKEFNQCRIHAERVLNIFLEKIQVSQLGVFNPESQGGMVLISQNDYTRVYTYEHRLIQRPNTYFQYKDICTRFAKTVPTNKNIYNLKWELLKSDEIKTGINTYAVQCEEELPHFETVLPLVKNQLLNQGFNQAY